MDEAKENFRTTEAKRLWKISVEWLNGYVNYERPASIG